MEVFETEVANVEMAALWISRQLTSGAFGHLGTHYDGTGAGCTHLVE